MPALPTPLQRVNRTWFSRDGQRVLCLAEDRTVIGQWTLPTFNGPADAVPKLVHLSTGREIDVTDGLATIDRNHILQDPAGYERAWKAIEKP